MTTTALTASELYGISSEFKAFLQLWDQERRCPIPLVDWLLEMGLDRAAEAARWAATKEDRPVYLPQYGERDSCCGPYPSKGSLYKDGVSESSVVWYWRYIANYASSIPSTAASNILHTPYSPLHHAPIKAILWLLDNWPTS